MNPTQPTTQGMDPQVINMAKAIRQTESGGNFNAKGASGESGAYQWTPNTWKAHASQALGDSNAPMTPSNQNAVAYTVIKSWKDQGLNPAQIAAKWNSGSEVGWENKVGTNSMGVKYDVPAYVKSVTDAYQTIKNGGQVGIDPNNPSSTAAPQPEAPSVSGFVGNIASSAGNVLSGLGQAVMHPITTAKTLFGTVAGAGEKAFGLNNADTQMFDNTVQYFKGKYGGNSPSEVAHNLVHTAYTDPVGVALDLSTLIDGVGAAVSGAGKIADIGRIASATGDLSKVSKIGEVTPTLSRAGQIGQQISDVGRMANPLAPIVSVAGKAIDVAKNLTTSVASHVVSLSDPASVTEIISNPSLYSKMAREQVNRGSVADEFGGAIDNLESSVQKTGSAYNSVKQAGGVVNVPENFFEEALSKYGLKIEPVYAKAEPGVIQMEAANPVGYKVAADTTSVTRNSSDISAVQKFINDWGDKQQMTHQEFLNMRADLAELANYDKLGTGGKTKDIQVIAHGLRDKVNEVMRPQVKGLKNLDEQYSPLIRQFNQAKKDFLTRTPEGYVFKDNAINKIANAAKTGKDQLLARMEAVSPGITRKLQILKTVEDIESAFKIKAGSYVRGIITGGGIMTGNIPTIIATIITHPAIAIPLLRGLGWSATKVAPITHILKMIAGDPTLLKYYAQAGEVANSATNPPSSNSKGNK